MPPRAPEVASPLAADSDPRPSRPLPGRDTGIELDDITEVRGGAETAAAPMADELEFDPTSIVPPPLDELPIPESDQVALLDFGLSLPAPAPTVAKPRASRPPAAQVVEKTRTSKPPQAQIVEKPRSPGLSPASSASRPARSSHPPHSPSSRPPRADASLGTSHSVPSLDIPSLQPQPKKVPVRSVPPPAAPANLAPEQSSGVDLSHFSTMGGEVDLGEGLDDLELGGASAAQQNLSLATKDEGDDIPWASGRTPLEGTLAVSDSEALDLSGFGPAPSSIFGAPLYAWRVFSAQKSLVEKVQAAERRLRDAEDRRDEKFAELAEKKRSELANKDRFDSIYSTVEKREEAIKLSRSKLEMADVEGAQALRDVQAEIEAFGAVRLEKQKIRDEKKAVFDAGERTQRRYQAALKRIQIEWRNIEARASKVPGREMPEELSEQLDVLEEQREQAKKDLSYASQQLKELKKLLDDAEDEVRVAVAQVQRAEGKKEGLLLAYEGDIADRSRALDKALFERIEELANVGRVIVDLRGAVPVDAEVRRSLLAADDEVAAAALHLATARRAQNCMDVDANQKGRILWVIALVALLALIVFSLV